jgi:CelD/BcsL family acetyltransferase involved in cellulose biosynthesis
VLGFETITSRNSLREFQAQWSAFVGRVPPETPFQTPDWLITWWEHFGSGDLRVMVFRQETRIVGVIPLFLHEWNGRRQLTLIGSGMTDCLDPLFEPECTPQIVDRLARELRGSADWDICDWQDLSANTPLASLGTTVEDTPCSFIAIEQPFDEYLSSLPKDLKRNLRRYKEKAEVIAPVTFQIAETAEESMISTLIELHRARWEDAGQSGMIEANGAERFLREAASRFASRGWLRIFAVRFGSRVTAVLLAFCYLKNICSYLGAFDPRDQTFGFGRELLLQAIRYAHERGYRCWNFLRGDEPYKFSWGAVRVEKRRVIIRR